MRVGQRTEKVKPKIKEAGVHDNIVKNFFKKYGRDYYQDVLVLNSNIMPKKSLISGRIRFTSYLPADCVGVFFREKEYIHLEKPVESISDLPITENTTVFGLPQHKTAKGEVV